MTWELADETVSDPPAAAQSTETGNRFANINMTAQQYIQVNENENTRRKTLGHQKLFEGFLQTKQESRQIHAIPPSELNTYLCEFILRVRQKDGTDYEPTSLRSIVSSLDRYLKRHNYSVSIIRGTEFRETMDVLSNKGKELKKKGLGNKAHASDAINDRTIDKLYEVGQLGTKTPISMIQTLWLNNCLHFGMRCGGSEHRHVCFFLFKLYINFHFLENGFLIDTGLLRITDECLVCMEKKSAPRINKQRHHKACRVMSQHSDLRNRI